MNAAITSHQRALLLQFLKRSVTVHIGLSQAIGVWIELLRLIRILQQFWIDCSNNGPLHRIWCLALHKLSFSVLLLHRIWRHREVRNGAVTPEHAFIDGFQ